MKSSLLNLIYSLDVCVTGNLVFHLLDTYLHRTDHGLGRDRDKLSVHRRSNDFDDSKQRGEPFSLRLDQT